MKFSIGEHFEVDGVPERIISGTIHYFRVVPEYWRDRLLKLKAMGCNTVETYVAWNIHEQKKGEFNFKGIADLEGFIKTAGEVGLYVIVRPSPYICAEWEYGGMPAWILAEEGMRVRCAYKPFLDHVADYYKELLPRLVPLQCTHGGPVVMMQVENEYGSYGSDKEYLNFLRDLMINGGIDVPLIVSDGGWDEMLEAGSIEGVMSTANFGSHAEEQFGILKEFIGEKRPLMCTEFWDGWFDYWGKEFHGTGPIKEAAECLDYMLEHGNTNFYMLHGGTNFGFWNGSNYGEKLTPDTTSYDYHAPISEDGRITPKYEAFKAVISKYREIPEIDIPETPRKAYGSFGVEGGLNFFDVLGDISTPIRSPYTLSMEQAGQSMGYILYRASRPLKGTIGNMQLVDANDRAQFYVDRKLAITLLDKELETTHKIDVAHEKGAVVEVLMENLGRVNYGHRLEHQHKGIKGGVVVNHHLMSDYEIFPLPMDNLPEQLKFTSGTFSNKEGLPGFFLANVDIDEPADTFLELPGWGKGFVILNGFNLGRYWEIGPQKRLYIPAPLLKNGKNQFIIFESEGKAGKELVFHDEPELGMIDPEHPVV